MNKKTLTSRMKKHGLSAQATLCLSASNGLLIATPGIPVGGGGLDVQYLRVCRGTRHLHSGQLPVMRNKWHVLIFKLHSGLSLPLLAPRFRGSRAGCHLHPCAFFTSAGFAANGHHFIVNGFRTSLHEVGVGRDAFDTQQGLALRSTAHPRAV